MENVNPVESNPLTSNNLQNSASASSASSVDYDAFLTLLVAELKNQDPTAPTDSAEFMSQLASFSSVEQQIQTNEKLNALIQSNQLGQASGLINKTVSTADGLTSGVVTSVALTSLGIIAELQDGSQVAIGDGIIITDPAENETTL